MRPGFYGAWLALAALAAQLPGCAAAERALVHQQDQIKVFPWPGDEKTVKIRAQPLTTLANSCFLFGSFEEVEVTPDTTFFIEDEAGRKFAYTPRRSPIRRLAKVVSIQIRWPPGDPREPPDAGAKVERKAEPPKEDEPGI